jgi:hypothetical protein
MNSGMSHAAQPASKQSPLPPAAVAQAVQPALELLSHSGGTAGPVVVAEQYAYWGLGHELAIIDVSIPNRPQQLGNLMLPGKVKYIAIDRQYGYVAVEGAGVRIVDIAQPAAPREVGQLSSSKWIGKIIIEHDTKTNKVYAYITEEKGLRIIDVTLPLAPIEIGVHRSITSRSIDVDGSHGYVWLGGQTPDGGFYPIDLTDRQNPKLLDAVRVFDGYGIITDILIRGDFAYLKGIDRTRSTAMIILPSRHNEPA